MVVHSKHGACFSSKETNAYVRQYTYNDPVHNNFEYYILIMDIDGAVIGGYNGDLNNFDRYCPEWILTK